MSTLFPLSRNAYHAKQPAADFRHSQFGSTLPIGYRASLFFGNDPSASAERRKKEAYRRELDHQMSEIASARPRAKDQLNVKSFSSSSESSLEPQSINSTRLPRLWSKTEPQSHGFGQLSNSKDFGSNDSALKQWSLPARRPFNQLSTNQNKSHWWTNILDNTGSMTDRRSDNTSLLIERPGDNVGFLTDRPTDKEARNWVATHTGEVDRDMFWQPNSQWDTNLGKNVDKRVHFGRGGNGIFGQPLTDEEKHGRLSYGEELKQQIEEKRRRKQEEKERLMREDMLLEKKIAEYQQGDTPAERRGRHTLDDATDRKEEQQSNYTPTNLDRKKLLSDRVEWPSRKSSPLPVSKGDTATSDRNTNDVGKIASPLSLLQSQSSFIAVPDVDSSVSPFDRFMLSSPRIGTPRSSAFDQRPKYSLQASMGSVTSLDSDNVQVKNQQRLHRLQLLQANNQALSSTDNPNEVLSAFLLRQK